MSSPDIFLSYNREDSERAKQFADGFAAQGLDVWWDIALRSGEAYDEVTEAALRDAKAVVVLWSQKSVVSRWVRAEATLAERRKTLMPAMIEPCERPIMFELVQTADLTHWNGEASDPAWQAFASHVRDFVGKGGAAKPAPEPAPVKRALPSRPSIAVLPFLNLSGDPEQEYFADGVVDDIISALSHFNELFVIARSASFTYKGRKVDFRTVADELGVRFVLEGSIRKGGNRLRISGQLVDTHSGKHLWTEKFEGELEDVFEFQDLITEQVVGAIEPSIQQAEIFRARNKPTENLDAYDFYLRALPFLWSFTPESNAPARELLEKALAIDPDYPQTLAAIAWAYTQIRWYGTNEALETSKRKAIEFARRALSTGSEDAYVLALSGWALTVTGHDIRTALDAKARAILHNPNSPWATHYSGLIETWSGNPEAGLQLGEKALRQNPFGPHRFIFMGAYCWALLALERWAEAETLAESITIAAPRWSIGLSQGAIASALMGEIEKAQELGRRMVEIEPEITVSGFLRRFPFPPSLEAAYRNGLGLAGISK